MSATLKDNVRVLEPNACATIEVTLKVKEIRRGKVSYPITIVGDDQVLGSVQARYTFEPPVDAVPRQITLAENERGQLVGSATVTVFDERIKEPPIVGADTNALITNLERTSNPFRYALDVAVAPDSPFGEIRGTVELRLPGVQTARLVLPVTALKKFPVQCVPEMILFGDISDRASREVTLISKSPFSVRDVISSSPGLVEITPLHQSPTERRYLVSVAPGASELVDEKVTISFEEPARFELVIPVIAEAPQVQTKE
jgi:hypothetical protein